MGKIVGIDLGTTNSVVAILEGGQPKVIANQQGGRTTPSVVAFTEKGERLVGQLAKRQAVTNPRNTVYSIKRFMGRRRAEVGEEEKMVPYVLTGGSGDPVKVEIRGKEYTPPEISAMVLQALKETAESYLGEKVTEAVITVPAYFNDSQRQATKDAGRIAGLNVRRIINEPTAAALAYGLDRKANEKIAVYDFGGGTFDISILDVGESVVEVRSTNGNTHLGGDNLDQILIHHVADAFRQDHGIDLRKDHMALQRLKEACEKAKCELSSSLQTEINLPFITADASGPKHLQISLSRADLERLIDGPVQSTLAPCRQALADAKMKPSDIDEVVLVGGSTRIPMVQRLVKEFFGKDPCKGVDPDEVVAVGAVIQGGVLSGEMKDILLLDVTPLTLGVETLGGIRESLIERNTTIPTSKKKVFTTAADSQPEVTVNVLQGERPMARDNRSLGQFNLTGIPPAPRNVPQIEVTFDIDADGILKVSAKELGTGKEASIQIKASTGISDNEIQRMVTDAESHAEEDSRKREQVEQENTADQLIYQTEKTLKDIGDKMDEAQKKKVEEQLEGLRRVRKEGGASAELKKAMESLVEATHRMTAEMYKKVSESQSAGAGHEHPGRQESQKSDGGDDEKIIDAEFEAK